MQAFKNLSASRSRSRSADSKENKRIIRGLTRLDDDPSRVVDSQESYEIIYDLFKMAKLDSLANNETLIEYFLENKHIIKLFSSIFTFIAKLNNELEYDKADIKIKSPNRLANLNERRISILYYLVVIIDHLSCMQTRNDNLYELNKQFVLLNGLDSLITMFKQQQQQQKTEHFKYFEKSVKKRDVQELTTGIYRILRNLSEIDDDSALKQWQQAKVVDTLKSFNSTYNNGKSNNNSSSSSSAETLNMIINEIELNLKAGRLEDAIRHLNQFRESPARLTDDAASYEHMLYLQKCVYRKSFKRWDLFTKEKMDELFGNLLAYFYKSHQNMSFANVNICYWYQEVPTNKLSSNERDVSIFHYTLRILDLLFFRSIEFLLSFSKHGTGLKALIAFCCADKFNRMLAYENQFVLETIMFSMSFLSRYASESGAEIWNEESMTLITHLIKLTKVREARDDIFLLAAIYSIIANLAKNELIRQLPDLAIVTKFLLRDIISLGEDFQHGGHVKIPKDRVQFYNDDGNKKIEEHEVSIDRVSLAPVTGKLLTLNKLCVNDSVRVLICQRIRQLKQILYHGNDIEKLYVIRLIHKVCKVDKCAQYLLDDKYLIAYLRNLERHADTKHEMKSLCHKLVDFADNYLVPSAHRDKFSSNSNH